MNKTALNAKISRVLCIKKIAIMRRVFFFRFFAIACLFLPSLAGAEVFTSTLQATDISGGDFHTCGVKTDGTVTCWGAGTTNTGFPNYGQASPPAGTFTQVSAGAVHTCGLETGGTVRCWGRDNDGESSPPAGIFTQVSAGGVHTCGLETGGTVACWGDNYDGQSSPPAGTFLQVSAGDWHTCGVETDGTVTCWGAGTTNTTGYPNYDQSSPPAGTFLQVSAGGLHTCGVETGGTVACWGYDLSDQASPPAGTFIQVSAGYNHTCGVETGGTVSCWGSDSDGQASPPARTFTQVSAEYNHTCGVEADGTVTCWGNNVYGKATPPTEYTYDASGIWNYTESNLQHNCDVTPYTLDSGQIGLLQTGDTFIIRADEYSAQGTVSGATYNYSDKWCDFFDSVEVSFDSNASITLQSLTEGSGSVNFIATWSGGSCTGSHNLSVSRPAPVDPVYDATGKWNFTLSDFSLNCGSPPFSSGYVDVIQTGNKVSATDNSGNTYNGFVDGTLYALLRSYIEDGGRMTETILVDLSSANKGIGDAGFVWDSDCDVCWGNWLISISKSSSVNIIPIISLLLDEDNVSGSGGAPAPE